MFRYYILLLLLLLYICIYLNNFINRKTELCQNAQNCLSNVTTNLIQLHHNNWPSILSIEGCSDKDVTPGVHNSLFYIYNILVDNQIITYLLIIVQVLPIVSKV